MPQCHSAGEELRFGQVRKINVGINTAAVSCACNDIHCLHYCIMEDHGRIHQLEKQNNQIQWMFIIYKNVSTFLDRIISLGFTIL